MRIAAIFAMSEDRVIGKNNHLPWRLPADMRHFKEITMGKPVLLGRKTYESIGKALPGRCNVVITRDTHFKAPGCVVAHSIETALDAVSYSDEALVIGGAFLYEQMLPQITRLYMTVIHHYFEGDSFFPEIDMTQWEVVDRIDCPKDSENEYAYSFITLDRKNRKK